MSAKTTDKTVVLAANITPLLTDDALFQTARAAATPARREKAARYRRREDAARCLAAEQVLRAAFARVGAPFPTEFLQTPLGKPYARNGWEFNLSHAGEWVLCAVAPDAVGCDVEEKNPAHVVSVTRALSEAEQAWIDAAPDETAKTDRFFRVWTLKESFQKATGQGLRLSPSSFSVTPGAVHAVATAPEAAFAEYDTLSGYACAVCRLAGGELPPLQIVELRDLLLNEVKR